MKADQRREYQSTLEEATYPAPDAATTLLNNSYDGFGEMYAK